MDDKPTQLPKSVQRRLAAIDPGAVVVAAVRALTNADVARFSVFNLAVVDGRVTAGDPVLLHRSHGLYAARNLDGWAEKRKDLPKELREICSFAPDWHGYGHHLVSRVIETWPVQFHPARLNTITATVIEPLRDGALIRFRVDQPLDRSSDTFARDLMFNMRLLREAVGAATIYPADMSDEDYTNIQQVSWELLPPGSADRVLARLACRAGVSRQRIDVAQDRLRTLDRLGHDGLIVGTGTFSSYFGAKFGQRLVVLEHLEYGNALYAFRKNWEKLSKLSRTELMRRCDPNVHRIPHKPGWQSAIRELLRLGSKR